MRTTLTLDEEVARRLHERARRTGASFKRVVNEALLAGLERGREVAPALPPFRVTAKACGFRNGIDVLRLNQLSDELESDALARARATAKAVDAR